MTKTPPPLTEAQKREIKRQVWTRMREIDHEIRMEAIKRRSAEFAATLARNRRTEERVSNELLDLRLDTWRFKRQMWETYTSKKGEPPPPLDMSLAKKLNRRVLESIDRGQDPQVQALRHHIAAICQELGVKSTFTVEYFGQGYAWASLKEIELPPINSAFAYATALHELGHCANPCAKSHVRVKTGDGKTCCVACELAAWKWAIANAIAWQKDMHESLTGGLSSYRKFGTPTEQAEIDATTSKMGLHRARQQCATKETKRND
jgi:hypothetical protein